MAIDGTLKHWNTGEPTLPDEGLTTLKYWNNGAPYTIVKLSAPSGITVLDFERSMRGMSRGMNRGIA